MSTVSQDVKPTIGFDELPPADFQKPTSTVPMPEQENDLPFYLIRPPPSNLDPASLFTETCALLLMILFLLILHLVEEALNGSTNLILHNDRQHAFKQYCCKKVKEPLSSFLPDFPGNINTTSFFVSGDEAKETR